MRIGFDGSALQSPAGGVRRYANELLSAIGRTEPDIQLVVLGASSDAIPSIIAEWRPVQRLAPTNLGWSFVDLPLAVRAARLDLFHAPAYTAPAIGVHPLILTIHDVSYHTHPEWYPHKRDPLRRWFYRRCARAADSIVTDSEFMRTEIAAAYDIDPMRIHVVPLGVGAPFVGAPRDGSSPQFADIREPFLLHVGDLHPRRNLSLLVRTISKLARTGINPSLVLAGSDRGDRAKLEREAGKARVTIRFIEAADDVALARLYVRAAAFVYPSRYEGFGLPMLEAMTCGTPVIAARTSAIPEVVGDAGILLDPDDEEAWAAAVADVLSDLTLASRLRRAGQERAARFTWGRTAAMTVAVYRASARAIS